MVAGRDGAGRAGGGHECRQPVSRVALLQMREHRIEGGAGAVIMDQVVGEFGELIEDDVVRVARKLRALVVDFLDVAFRPRRADDVGRIGHPLLQPVETFLAHARRQHGDTAAAENARNGDAAAAVVSGRRPHGAVLRRIELAGHQAGHQARIGGEHLVGADHGKPAAQQDDDRRFHAGQGFGQDHVAGHRHEAFALRVIEPVDPPQVRRRSASSGPTEARPLAAASGIRAGSASSLQVGSTTCAARSCSIAARRRFASTT